MPESKPRRIYPLEEVVPDEALAEMQTKLERLADKDPTAKHLLDKLAAGTAPPAEK